MAMFLFMMCLVELRTWNQNDSIIKKRFTWILILFFVGKLSPVSAIKLIKAVVEVSHRLQKHVLKLTLRNVIT